MPHSGGSALPGTILAAATCILLGTASAGCESSGPLVSAPQITFTCCSASITAKPWHPGQHLLIHWTEQGYTRAASGKKVAITLTAVLTGPYRTVMMLKAANARRLDSSRIIASALPIAITRVTPTPPVSVIAIPAGAAPGFYNLEFTVGSPNVSDSGDAIITVS